MSEFTKRKKSEYSKAVREAERETKFYRATHLKATVPAYRIELDRRIAELRLAWRSPEEKQALIRDAIRQAKSFVRQAVKLPETPAEQIARWDVEYDRWQAA